ncbi:hypothetical protein L0244_15130 [bacterium]|nr:hypothetical protein [bacterium]
MVKQAAFVREQDPKSQREIRSLGYMGDDARSQVDCTKVETKICELNAGNVVKIIGNTHDMAIRCGD